MIDSFISSSVGTDSVEQIVGLRFKPNDASLSQDLQSLPEITEMKLAFGAQRESAMKSAFNL